MQIQRTRLIRLMTSVFAAIFLVSCLSSAPESTMNSINVMQRSFYQGFMYQPFDWSEAAFEETFQVIGDNSDKLEITYFACFSGCTPPKAGYSHVI